MAEEKKKNLGGRPPKYTCKEEIEGKIDEYFTACEGKPYVVDGKVMTDKMGYPIILGKRPPTMTGLALSLGFKSRQALISYEGKKEFADTITRAKSRVELYTEEQLFTRDGANGAKFSLQNNFKGWDAAVREAAAQAASAAATAVKIIYDIPKPTPGAETSPEASQASQTTEVSNGG